MIPGSPSQKAPIAARRLCALSAAALCLLVGTARAGDVPPEFFFSARVSAMKRLPDALGPGWHGPAGCWADEGTNAMPRSPEAAREAAAAFISKYGGAPVSSFAELLFTREVNRATAHLTVLVFENAQTARGWWKGKYRLADWEQEYIKADYGADDVTDARNGGERAIRLGNVCIVARQAPPGEDYLGILDMYVAKLKLVNLVSPAGEHAEEQLAKPRK